MSVHFFKKLKIKSANFKNGPDNMIMQNDAGAITQLSIQKMLHTQDMISWNHPITFVSLVMMS